MNDLEDLHADRTHLNVQMFFTTTTMKAEGEGWDPAKLA